MITKPLATRAVAACRCERAERYRWTIIWSAPWVAVFSTIPPINPAQNVNGRVRSNEKSRSRNLPAACADLKQCGPTAG